MLLMNIAEKLIETHDTIELTAPEKSDFLFDELNFTENNNSPFYYDFQEDDFVFRAKIRPDFKAFYDAGGLFICDTKTRWIKLEFEKTDLGHPSVVSVVTDNKTSDCCNGESFESAKEVHLQIVRKGDHFYLHYSTDGENWKMVRYFKLIMPRRIKVGFVAQSPIGNGCTVLFSHISLSKNTLLDPRKGV